MKKIFLLLIPIIFMNCATVSFYKNEDLTQETGLKFYHSKPYLLVEKSPQKDIKIKSTIIYLPDLENPTYAEIKPGFGSSDLKLDLENGVLKSYGFTSDNKIPETVGALAGSLTSVTGAYKTITEAIGILDGIDNSQEEETEQQSSDADKVKLLQKIEPDVKLTVKDLNKLKVTEPSDIALRDAVKADVSTIVQEIGNYDPSKIKEIAKGLRANAKRILTILSTADTEDGKNLNSSLNKISKKLIKAADTIDKPKAQKSEWELYEIVISGGKTKLVKVEIGK